MIGLGKVWKAVTGGRDEGAAPAQPASTIPRDLAALRPAPVEPDRPPADGEPSDTREAERFVPDKTATVLTTANGKRLSARIINISRTGVAVETEHSGIVPEEVTLVGTRPVTPGRRIALGMVFMFSKPLDPKLCRPDIVL
jgi:hypothetical protein